MPNTWILVADSSCAKIFKSDDGLRTLTETEDLIHTESRLHEQEMSTDLPGTNKGEGNRRHSFESRTGIKENEAINFSRDINAKLEEGRENDEFNKLIIAAAPAFLGVLRQNINPHIARSITHEFNKDLTKCSAVEIREYLSGKLYAHFV